MKKVVLFIVMICFLISSFAFVGCSKDKKPTYKKKPPVKKVYKKKGGGKMGGFKKKGGKKSK